MTDMCIVVIVNNNELPLQSSMCPSFFCLAQALHCHYSSQSLICRLFTLKGSELTSLSALTRQGLRPIFVQLRTTLLLVLLRPAPATTAQSLVHPFDLGNWNLKTMVYPMIYVTEYSYLRYGLYFFLPRHVLLSTLSYGGNYFDITIIFWPPTISTSHNLGATFPWFRQLRTNNAIDPLLPLQLVILVFLIPTLRS